MPKLCSLGCASSGVPMHRFPNADKFPERFNAWVNLVGGKLKTASDYAYYQTKLVCDIHFTTRDRNRNNRLNALAVPSLHLHDTLAREPDISLVSEPSNLNDTNTELNEACKMGAKTPEQINKARPTVKCDVCGRKFLNVQALKSHHKFLHSKQSGPKRLALKKQDTKTLRKKVVSVHMLKRVSESPKSKQKAQPEKVAKSPELAGKLTVSKKPEFECPICEEKFPVYFKAFRHIQKNHCVDDNGAKVPPNSPLLVKPIRIEICGSCRKEIRSTELHNCPKQQTNRDKYLCLGCQQVFSGLVLFQHHVKGFHVDGAQNYFFPTREEFVSWKTDLQKQTNNDFVRLNKQKSKEVYHCSHHSANVTCTTELCPATIIVREYTKGFHVWYYKEHHGHTIDNTVLKKYSQYCISFFTREAEDLQLEDADDNDLYLQFKKMLTCIVYDAAKIDVNTLKELLGKALEMTTVLKHYQSEDRNTPLISKCLTDAQISKTLDSLKPSQGKRKLSSEAKEKNVEVKKVKKTPSIEKTIENGMNSRLRSSPALSRSSPTLNKSVSFTRSTPKKTEETPQKLASKKTEETPQKSALKKIEETPQKIGPKKNEETLQKMGPKKNEETPKKIGPKKNEETQLKSVSKKKSEDASQKSSPKKTVEPENKGQEQVNPPTPTPRSILQSPSSFNDSYKNFVDQNFKSVLDSSTPRPKTYSKKKDVVKTKIGQFKVKSLSTSPKNSSPQSPKEFKDSKEVPVLPKTWKAKEIKYEVKEQENDCNILILKI